MYTPRLFETEDIVLPDDLLEELAASVHDAWAARKLQEGWTYGEKKSEANKITPCLVPYNELPESEKEYNRCTVSETIRGLIKKGHQVVLKGKTKT